MALHAPTVDSASHSSVFFFIISKQLLGDSDYQIRITQEDQMLCLSMEMEYALRIWFTPLFNGICTFLSPAGQKTDPFLITDI